MSVDGFNRQYRSRKSKSDFIRIYFDPDVIPIEKIAEYFQQIAKLPERHNGTMFTMCKDGLYFKTRRVK